MRRLDGQTVVVTGAAGGLGSLIAVGLGQAGAFVRGIDRVGCPACDDTILADLSSPAELERLCGLLGRSPVDILVNVAGVQYFGPVERQDPASIQLCYAVNLIAPATLIRAVLPQMRARRSGQIASIGSVMGSINYPHFACYSSSKAGLRGLSEGLRREVHGEGIAVTYIAPRAVKTGFNDDAVNRFLALAKMQTDDPHDVADRIVAAILARRKDVTFGWKERLFMRINGLMPRLVDAGLAAETLKARQLFT